MSRLYDRVIANDCEPLSALVVYDFGWEIDEAETDFRRQLAEKLGRPPWDAEVAARFAWSRQELQRSTSTDVFSRGDIENSVVVSAEEVADYVSTLPDDTDLTKALDRLAPPFARYSSSSKEGQTSSVSIRGGSSWTGIEMAPAGRSARRSLASGSEGSLWAPS